uniref:RNA-dependent RNA polymerase n=1 Tax=Panagrolaimus sp. PS1159 TaxID=55785 RepID=A0AC35FR66_9BILA
MRNNIDRKRQKVEDLRLNFFSKLKLDHFDSSSLTISKDDVENAKLVCSTLVHSNKLSCGFTAAKTFCVIDILPIVEADFQHHGSELVIKSQNTNGSLKMIFKYQSFVKVCYDVIKRTENSYEIKLIFTTKHSPMFFAKPETNEDESFIRIPVKNDPEDRFYNLCRSTSFQLCFNLDKPDLEAFFLQLYSLLSCPTISQSYSEAKFEITNALDEFVSEWPWNVRYYVEVVKSCGHIGSFFLRNYLFNILEFLYDVDGFLNVDMTKIYLTNLYEYLKSDLSWANMDLPEHIFDFIQRDDKYELIKTAYITPTRVIYTFEETTLNSRGFRLLGLENLLLVKFRDDTLFDFPPDDVDETILNNCQNGIKIADRQFYEYGGSSSLFRDFGTYFYATNNKAEIPTIWKRWGEFKEEPAAKVAARIGQYFTSAKILGLKLRQNQVELIDDFYSTAKDSSGKPYCFSDGVGLISQKFAEQICKKLDLSYTASAFQIRYAGYKGMVSVDPKSVYFDPECGGNFSVCFRHSQKKFNVIDNGELDFEVVQVSAANQASLHRIFIIMLDALAKDQGKQEILHDRLKELQNNEFNEILNPLIDKNAFIKKLEKLPKYFPVSKMTSINLMNEPFLRSMVEADAVLTARILSTKSKIPIPTTLGRNALGIVDTSGKLQKGQIFFQYSIELKIKSQNRKTTIKKGPVGVTKSPINHAGDIRFLEAVDIPELHHLIDVIVFPSCGGHRPVTDEIGGGDLDGDMYVVFWDPAWLLENNAKAANYTSPSTDKLKKVKLNELQEAFPKFRAEYTKENNNKKLDPALLAHLILHRPDHNDCERLAKKSDIAVNYFKSGLAAGRLNENEKPGHWPKFKGARHEPAFTSSHILCHLHEQSEAFYQLIQIAQKEALKQRKNCPNERNVQIPVTAEDRAEFEQYKIKIEALMTKYQIKSEGELFANAFLEVAGDFKNQKRFGEGSVPSIVQDKVFEIFREYRTKILDKFQPNWKFDMEQKQISFFNYKIMDVTEEMKSLAKRYYALSMESKKFFSFPWIIWEGLDAWWKIDRNKKTLNLPTLNRNQNYSLQIQSVFIKYAFLPNDKSNINLFQQIINYPPFVVYIPNIWAEGFQQNYHVLKTQSGCKEIAVGIKKTFQNCHHFVVMCRGTLESCRKLEALLTPFIEPDFNNKITFTEMKKRKNEAMQKILQRLFQH